MKLDKNIPHVAIWFKDEGAEFATVAINKGIVMAVAMEKLDKDETVAIVAVAFENALRDAVDGMFQGRKQ